MNRIAFPHMGTAARTIVLAIALAASAHAADQPTHPGPANGGRAVFQKWCMPCHGVGADKPGTVALATLYKGAKPAALEERTDLTPEIVRQFVRHGVSVMPFFRKTEISDSELDALANYLSHAKS